MMVLVDATALGDGSAMRGVGRYLRAVVSGLAVAEDVQMTMLTSGPVGGLPDSVRQVAVRRVDHHRVGPWVHDHLLSHEIAAQQADVFWSPAFTPPRSCGIPWVQTLHDLTPFVFPDPLLRRDARRWTKVGPRLRSAAAVITVSHSSAKQAERHLGIDPARIRVIPLGVEADFTPDASVPRSVPPRLLWVGSWGPHKGLAEAVGVSDLLRAEGSDHRLRIVGTQDAWQRARIDEIVARAAHPDVIDVVGSVTDIVDEYRRARLLLMTSRAEGFGLPVVEARACGCPVVAFDNTSLLEVIGTAGVLVPDGDVPAAAAAAAAVLASSEPPVDTSVPSWDACVMAHHDVLAGVAR